MNLHPRTRSLKPETQDTPPLILIVDDLDENRKLIENFLKQEESCRVVFATNGIEAIEVFKRQTVSMILIDMEMPVMDGYTAVRAIRGFERGAEIPIIAMIPHEEIEQIKRCLEAGCTAYLANPIRKENLVELIRYYLGRTKTLSPDTSLHDKPVKQAEQEGGMYKDIVVYVDPDLEDLIPQFLENMHKDAEEIKRLLAEGDFKTIQRIGHSMKGAGGSYGFNEISSIGRDIEEAAKKSDKEEIMRLRSCLVEYLSVVKFVPRE